MNEDGTLIRIFPALSGRSLTVEDMDLEAAVRNALKGSGIHTVDRLLQLNHSELVKIFRTGNCAAMRMSSTVWSACRRGQRKWALPLPTLYVRKISAIR